MTLIKSRIVLADDVVIIDRGICYDRDGGIVHLSISPMTVDIVVPDYWRQHFGLCEIEHGIIAYRNVSKNDSEDKFRHMIFIFHGNLYFSLASLCNVTVRVTRFISSNELWLEIIEAKLKHILK